MSARALIEGELASVERASPAQARSDSVGADLLPPSADLGAARSQMAFALGFHIILASMGVAFPAIILTANYIGLREGRRVALQLAQRWSKVAAVTLRRRCDHGHGALVRDGPPVARVHGPLGEVFGPAFALEEFFFFLEAIFMAIYIFGWKRLRPWVHFWTGVPVVLWGARRRSVGGRERVDEHADRLPGRPTVGRRRRPGRGGSSTRQSVRGAPHDPRGLHGRRLPRGVHLRGGHAAGAAGPPPPPRPADPVDVAAVATPIQLGSAIRRARWPTTSPSSSRLWKSRKTAAHVTDCIFGRCNERASRGHRDPGPRLLAVGFSTDTEVKRLDSVPPDDRPPQHAAAPGPST